MISVIIAAYNVENYIEKCIESVINQTYKNLEIIVVNDGSTDTTYQKIKILKQKYPQLIIINKQNGGLSSARNAGIEKATGNFITFVDGDDYIKKNMYDVLRQTLLDNNADISICGFIRKYSNDEIFSNTGKLTIYNSYNAIKELVESRRIYDFAWDKLYKLELFKNIKYPDNKLYEDVYTTYKVFHKANCIAHVDVPLYYYVQRKGSILRSKFTIREFDLIDALDQIENFIILNKYNDLMPILERRKVNAKIRIMYNMLKNKAYNLDNNYDYQLKVLMKELRPNVYKYIKDRNVIKVNKIILLLSKLNLNFIILLLKTSFIKKIISKKESLL